MPGAAELRRRSTLLWPSSVDQLHRPPSAQDPKPKGTGQLGFVAWIALPAGNRAATKSSDLVAAAAAVLPVVSSVRGVALLPNGSVAIVGDTASPKDFARQQRDERNGFAAVLQERSRPWCDGSIAPSGGGGRCDPHTRCVVGNGTASGSWYCTACPFGFSGWGSGDGCKVMYIRILLLIPSAISAVDP